MDHKKYIEPFQIHSTKTLNDTQKKLQYSKLTLRNKKKVNQKNQPCTTKLILSPCTPTPSEKQKNNKKSKQKSQHKKSYLNIYESKLMQTQHSSLSHSTYKTKAVNLDLRKQKNKATQGHFNSLRHQTSQSKYSHKSSILNFNTSEKSTVKLQLSNTRPQLQQVYKRTKSVLDCWNKEKSNWVTEKNSYELKITELNRQIANLKSKINISDS